MIRPIRRFVGALACAVTLALAASAVAPAAAAPVDAAGARGLATESLGPAAFGPGYSTPVSDSKYPAFGNPAIDVLSYKLDLKWEPLAKRLRGTATLDIRPVSSASSFWLNLGKPLQVSGVQVGPTPADPTTDPTAGLTSTNDFTHIGRRLTVSYPVVADEPVTVVIAYSGTPATAQAPTSRGDLQTLGWHGTSDGQVWTMQEPYGAYTWYPVNDQPSDKAMYTVSLNVPDKFVGVSNGELVSRQQVGSREVTSFSNSQPMASYLMTVAIGPYRRYTQTGPNGLPLTYWYPRGQSSLLTPLKKTPGALQFLESRLGPYPFDRAGVVVVPAKSAIETQTLITLGAATYKGGNQNVRETVLHELAHSWYGDSVTPTDWSDLWMNEGFAMWEEIQYSVAKHWRTWSSWKDADNGFTRNDDWWRYLYGPPGSYKSGQFAQINVYYCTVLMLNQLRLKVGDPTFDKMLRDWPTQHADSNANRADYVSFADAESGQSLGSFFDAWLNGSRTPTS